MLLTLLPSFPSLLSPLPSPPKLLCNEHSDLYVCIDATQLFVRTRVVRVVASSHRDINRPRGMGSTELYLRGNPL